jgi:hypothetical protein
MEVFFSFLFIVLKPVFVPNVPIVHYEMKRPRFPQPLVPKPHEHLTMQGGATGTITTFYSLVNSNVETCLLKAGHPVPMNNLCIIL